MSKSIIFIFGLWLIFLSIGCSTRERPLDDSATRVISTPIQTQATVTNTPMRFPPTSTILPSATPTSTPFPTETRIPPSPTATAFLQDVSHSDPIWSPVVQRVNELQGFYIVALSPDGKLLAVVERNDDLNNLSLWEIETNSVKWVIDTENFGNSGLVFSPDGKLLANSTSIIVQDVFVLDVVQGNQLHHFRYEERPSDLTFSPDSHLLIMSGGIPGATTIWNLENGEETEIGRSLSIEFLPGSEDPILALARGQKYPDDPSPVLLLNLQTNDREYLFSGGYFSSSVAFSPDGKYLAASVSDEAGLGNIRLLDLKGNFEIQLEGEVEPQNVRAEEKIAFSSNGYLAALQDDLRVWSLDGKLLGVIDIDRRDVAGFLFTPDGKYLITYGGYQSPMTVWELPSP